MSLMLQMRIKNKTDEIKKIKEIASASTEKFLFKRWN